MNVIHRPYRILILTLVLIALVFVGLTAQDSNGSNQSTLSKDKIGDLIDLAKYDKTVKKLKPKRRGQTEGSNKVEDLSEDEEASESPRISLGGGGPFIKWILYLLIAALVVFILVAIFSSVKVEKDIKKIDKDEDETIEDIEVIDAEYGLENALNAENYRDAVRMLFIKLLQLLVEEGSLIWKPEKTNRDYLREMNSHAKVNHFSNLVMAYERIWYGRSPIDRPFFDFLREDFEKFYSTENLNVHAEE